MKAIWISCLAWQKDGKYRYKPNNPGGISGSIFQQSLIEGMEQSGASVDILSDYPATDKKYVKSFYWSHNNNSKNTTITSLNIPIISIPIKAILLCKEILKYNKKNEYDYAIGYLMHTPYLLGICLLKKLNKNIKAVLVCPDLPQYMDMSLDDKIIKNILKKIDYIIIERLLKYIDGFVLFSKEMNKEININNKSSIVIEGVYSSLGLDLANIKKSHAIMHAGTLHKNIGIEEIIEAFKLIKDEKLELWFFGDGELREYIKNQSKIDNRIKFFGFRDREEVFEYEKRATLLINARNPDDEYTKFSFPSKTFEYMVSGTPFLTTKLDGIPEEYYRFLYTMESNRPNVISKHIMEVLNTSFEERERLGLRARSFVLNYKNKKIQGEKMNKFLSSLQEE